MINLKGIDDIKGRLTVSFISIYFYQLTNKKVRIKYEKRYNYYVSEMKILIKLA